MTNRPKLPVLVVGNGPVGLLTALGLAKLDVEVIIITRHMRRLGIPKAHALSPRSLEICRQLGIPVKGIRRLPAHRKDARWVRFMTTCDGVLVGTLPYENMDVDVLGHTPEMVHNVAQPDLEEAIEDMINEENNVNYWPGWTWIGHREVMRNGEKICISTVEDTATGEEKEIESYIIIGADGANSRVRRSVGIESEGEETADTMITIHFHADLRSVVRNNVAMLYWILDPAARGFIISYDIDNNHVLIHNIDPDRTPLSSFTPEECVKLVHAAIGKEIPIDFQSSMPWVLRRKVAYQYHKGLVVLAGDSAHSFPPTGGLGLNSGIADAHNLAYKVAAAYHGWADLPTVLRAYEAERRPVAVHNSIQSVHNGRTVFRLLKALYSSGPIEEARRRMHATLRDPNKAPFINALIADQAGHFDNINRHLGYVYEPGWAPGKQRDFAPIYKRGARLAHAWIKAKSNINKLTTVDPVYLDYLDDQDLSPKKKQAWTYSTLDCIPHGEYVFFYSCSSWRKKTPALRELFARCRVPLRLLEVGKDFDFVDKKPGKAWSEGYGINKKNGVLVRPDQHVAVIAHSDVGPELILSGVLTDLGKR